VNEDAATPPKLTLVAPVNALPVIVATVPGTPQRGERVFTVGRTLNQVALRALPAGVVTVILPGVAPNGTLV